MRHRSVGYAAAVVLSLALPSVAAAQAQTRANLAAGYSYLREIGSDGATYGKGWLVSAATRPGPAISWVGEIGGSYRAPAGLTQKLLSYLGGARFSRSLGAIAPFAQVLAGAERFSEPGFSETGLAVQPGGGVDVALASRLALRGQLDYRWVRVAGESGSPAETFKEWRLGLGVVIGLGR